MKTRIVKPNRKSLALLALTLLSYYSRAQTVLERYVQEGIQSNLVLQQKDIGLQRAQQSLKEANAMFLPSLNVSASYQSGEGGRYFSFPVGDMVNPVYTTLNQLTGTHAFPQIENQEAYLNPHNYYDAHLRTSMPLLNTNLYNNQKLQKQQIVMQEQDVAIYKRDLVKNIKVAYYNYLAACAGVRIYESALVLVNKNVDVNQSLLDNGKGLPANVLRSKSELETIKAQLLTANNQAENAKHYFNFLLNKSLDTAVDSTYDEQAGLQSMTTLLNDNSIDKREELIALKQSVDIQQTVLNMNRQYWVPQLNAFLDLGSQATDWQFNNKSRYYLLGVQLDFPVFNGFRNRYKINKSQMDLNVMRLQQSNMNQQLQLSATMSKDNLLSIYNEYKTAQVRLQSAESYFRLIDAGYRQGSNSLIEYLDARNQLTGSQMNLNISLYKVLQAAASVERETANYTFSK